MLKYPLRRVPLLSVLTSSLGLSFLIQKMRLVSGQGWQRSFPSRANSNPWQWLRTGLGNLRLQLGWCHDVLSPSVITNSLRPHSPGKNTGMGCHAHLHRIFLTQESNWYLLLLHWQVASLPLAPPSVIINRRSLLYRQRFV